MAMFKTMHIGEATIAAVPVDVVVVGTINDWSQITNIATRKAAVAKQDFVRYFPATGIEGQAGYIPAYIRKATAAEVTAQQATHVVAQADMTMSGRHAATDLRDYRYVPLVAAMSTAAPTDASITPKKVNLWPIFNWNDVLADQVPDAEAIDRN
jgi:hypothetical protein